MDLLALYHQLRARAATLPPTLVERLGCPFLPFPHDNWWTATRRLLIVGQEPRDWGFDAKKMAPDPWPYDSLWYFSEFLKHHYSVEALTKAYLAETHGGRPSPPTPFVTAVNVFRKHFNRHGRGDVLTTNIFRCALYTESNDKLRSPLNAVHQDLQQILDWQRGCLSGEVRVLRPKSVLFLTGPRYDSALADEFPGATFEPVAKWTPRQVARIVHEQLPAESFRTYHPGYLRRGKWGWLTELATLLDPD